MNLVYRYIPYIIVGVMTINSNYIVLICYQVLFTTSIVCCMYLMHHCNKTFSNLQMTNSEPVCISSSLLFCCYKVLVRTCGSTGIYPKTPILFKFSWAASVLINNLFIWQHSSLSIPKRMGTSQPSISEQLLSESKTAPPLTFSNPICILVFLGGLLFFCRYAMVLYAG
ncbi:hypothetical protein GDO78_012412 [Eleutherodactylus coqui]|uniref:Uncharacterized protein n=1 Tax=Eleutherodactylus coqui TaxID=57060 RepID=A0A8J6F181_ELECQ|nr:hypothetical protein GDO78_012412 [Eleutherodactylus coqui]